jgi:hypothetical protein
MVIASEAISSAFRALSLACRSERAAVVEACEPRRRFVPVSEFAAIFVADDLEVSPLVMRAAVIFGRPQSRLQYFAPVFRQYAAVTPQSRIQHY